MENFTPKRRRTAKIYFAHLCDNYLEKTAFWVGTDYLLHSSDRVGIGFSRFRLLAQTERSAGEKSRISSAGFADFLHRGGLTRVFNQNYTEIFTASYRKVFQRLQNYIRNARKRKRTQRSESSFIKNGKERKDFFCIFFWPQVEVTPSTLRFYSITQ